MKCLGINNKYQILEKELQEYKIDIAILTETKTMLNGCLNLNNYILLYGGVPTDKRARAGVGIMIKGKIE